MQKLNILCCALIFASIANCGNTQAPIHANFERAEVAAKEVDGKLKINVKLDDSSEAERRLILRYGGTADLGLDFRGPGEIIIPPRATSASFEIELLQDGEAECPETIVIDLGGSDGVRRQLSVAVEDSDVAVHRLSVGTPKGFSTIASAIQLAQPGDVIEISEGDYAGDVATIKTDDVVLCGLGRGAHVLAAGRNVEGKAIWVVKSNRVRIENIKFSGAKVPDKNGAGIRAEGNDLTIRHARFMDNENGILAGELPESTITVEHSEFIHGGAGDGRSHNVYIGKVKKFVARFSLFRDAVVGHNVKSRARETVLEYNRIMDGATGKASYQVDLPNGGRALLLGNVIQQGPNAENWTMVSYGAEGIEHPDNVLVMANNTVVNDRHSALFVQAPNDSTCVLINNVFSGKGDMQCSGGERMANVTMASGFVEPGKFDYRARKGAASIDAGVVNPSSHGFEIQPMYQIWHDNFIGPRTAVGAPDAGAYEFQP